MDAAAEVKDKVVDTGADGVNAARRLGNETVNRARTVGGGITGRITQRPLRRPTDDEDILSEE